MSEREALIRAFEGAGLIRRNHPFEQIVEADSSYLADTVLAVLPQIKADAWDEGYHAGQHATVPRRLNPYRALS